MGPVGRHGGGGGGGWGGGVPRLEVEKKNLQIIIPIPVTVSELDYFLNKVNKPTLQFQIFVIILLIINLFFKLKSFQVLPVIVICIN